MHRALRWLALALMVGLTVPAVLTADKVEEPLPNRPKVAAYRAPGGPISECG